MAAKDKLVYFPFRGRAEPVRMIYALAGEALEDEHITSEEWPQRQAEFPLGQLPLYTCKDGALSMSNSVARYVAKKFGFMGSNIWEEALNDVVVETCQDIINDIIEKVYVWKILKRVPEPENSEKICEDLKELIVKSVNYIQSLAEKRAAKHLTCDKIGLGDLWLFNALEFCKPAFPDIMEITPWVKEFSAKVQSDEKMKKYLAARPEAVA